MTLTALQRAVRRVERKLRLRRVVELRDGSPLLCTVAGFAGLLRPMRIRMAGRAGRRWDAVVTRRHGASHRSGCQRQRLVTGAAFDRHVPAREMEFRVRGVAGSGEGRFGELLLRMALPAVVLPWRSAKLARVLIGVAVAAESLRRDVDGCLARRRVATIARHGRVLVFEREGGFAMRRAIEQRRLEAVLVVAGAAIASAERG